MPSSDRISVVLIDNEERALNRLSVLLSHIPEVEVKAQFTNPDEGISYVAKENPNLLFLDIEMPSKTGLEVAEELNKHYLDTKIAFITSHEHYAIKAIKNKAYDYLLKPVGLDNLKEVVKRYNLEFKTQLTKREFEIISLIAKGFKSKEIGEKLFLSRHTIDTYRRTILEKTNCKNAAELISYATRNNLI